MKLLRQFAWRKLRRKPPQSRKRRAGFDRDGGSGLTVGPEQLEPRYVLDALSLVDYDRVSPAWFQTVAADAAKYDTLAYGFETATDVQASAAEPAVDPEVHRWVVRFTQEALQQASITSVADTGQLLNTDDSNVDYTVIRGLGLTGQILVQTIGEDEAAVEADLEANANLAYFLLDSVVVAQFVPDDVQFDDQWALDNTGLDSLGQPLGIADADIDAPEAWDITTGSRDIVVAIIDSGIDLTHPDLVNNLWINPGEIPDNELDDDGNGFVDDYHGYDFHHNDPDPQDDSGHGTHVAGIIGAEGNNTLGVAGVNHHVSLMSLQFLSDGNVGATANAVRAVNYATMMRESFGVDIKIINNSWGGGEFNQALLDAIEASAAADILFVAGAGNGDVLRFGIDNDLQPFYPASYEADNIISVTATDRSDNLAPFSNFGSTSVDVAAPGVGILSTSLGGGYSLRHGTSMAAAFVSGAGALKWATFPEANADEIRAAILTSTDPLPSAADQAKLTTGGRVNARSTLDTDTIAPRATAVLGGAVEQGVAPRTLFVTYRDDKAVAAASLDDTDISVVRADDPTSQTFLTLREASSDTDAPAITATYEMLPPGGTWNVADNGEYVIQIAADAILDAAGNPILDLETTTFAEFMPAGPISEFPDGFDAVFATDMDGDDDTDVLSASDFSGKISWYENRGHQNFIERPVSVSAIGANSVFASDLDGDDDVDVVTASYFRNEVLVYYNNGGQTFTESTIQIPGVFSVSPADFDGDGDDDIVSLLPFDDEIVLIENRGVLGFETFLTLSSPQVNSVTATDLDGDGDTDLLSTSTNDRLQWFENSGSGFTAHLIDEPFVGSGLDPYFQTALSLFGADLDGDGDTDVVSSSFDVGGISWFENDGNQQFLKRIIELDFDIHRIALSDVDRDGDTDILSTLEFSGIVLLYENDGDQNFTPQFVNPALGGFGPLSILAADTDGDGDDDMITASKFGDAFLYENLVEPLDNGEFSVEARSIGVDVFSDSTDETPGDGVAENALGQSSLRAAVIESNASLGADEIMLSPGTYTLSISGKGEDVAETGDLDITDDLTIIGAGADRTIIDANQLDRVFHVHSTGLLTLIGVTVRDGKSASGGALRNDLGNVSLVEVRLTGNTSTVHGGGIFNNGELSIDRSTIDSNSADADGGGIYNNGQATLINATVSRNTAARYGGAVFNSQFAALELENATVAENSAIRQGGGVFYAESDEALDLLELVPANGGVGSAGFLIQGSQQANEHSAWSATSAGDMNGDGFDDVLLGAPGFGGSRGAAYVVFGQSTGIPPLLDLSLLDGANGFRIEGVTFGDKLGESVAPAGDVNGDGFGDLILGTEKAGLAYVVLGRPAGYPATLDLSSADSNFAVRLAGFATSDLTFRPTDFVRSAGDLNGDGFDDIVIGAEGGVADRGEAYVIFGRDDFSSLGTRVWGAQPATGQIVVFDLDGQQLASFSAPGDLRSTDTKIGLSIADGGESLLYVNSDSDPNTLYRLDPVTGAILSTESLSGAVIDGLGFEELAINPYEAAPTSFEFEDINGSGTPVLTGADDSFVELTSSTLGGFTFEFYGTTYDSLFVSSNGLVTFESGTSSLSNDDFTNLNRPAIAVLWDDLDLGDGTSDSSVFWEVRDPATDDERLIIQWEDIQYYSYVTSGDPITFQVVLYERDGAIRINYEDITSTTDSVQTDGKSATVGINRRFKTQGDGSLLLSHNSAPNSFVGSGQSLLISQTNSRLLFLSDDGNSIRRQEGYSGPETTGWAIGSPTGALGGDDSGRQFGFFTDGQIHEFDPFVDTDTTLNSFSPPSADLQGMAFDGTQLYASDGGSSVYVLNPDTGAVLSDFAVANGAIYGLAASDRFDVALLNGDNGFRVLGESPQDQLGSSVGAAGDVNGDGYGDLIVGAQGGTGAAYVLFGSESFPQQFDLSTLDGTNGFRFDGEGGDAGHSVSGAGDVNGDGFDDFIIGAPGEDAGDSASGALGESYVVYGQGPAFPPSFSVADLDGTNGFRIVGAVDGSRAGSTVSGAGDVNADGFDDLIIGGFEANSSHASEPGVSYVVLGGLTHGGRVWGAQPATGKIVVLNASGQELASFPAPGVLDPTDTNIGLSIADGGESLLYVNSDSDPNTLYRLDPETGAILSTESLSGAIIDGLGFEESDGVGPNAFGYAGSPSIFEFEDISGSGTPVLTGDDDAFVELTTSDLGDFDFEFYGTTYDSLFVSSNGLVTFESGSSSFSNNSLTSPTPPAIAVLWDDLDLGNSTSDSSVYWEVRDPATDDERLIIQWEDIQYFSYVTSGDPITFQVILYERDGAIRINYEDITSTTDAVQTDGKSATVGIKRDSSEGDDPLLVSYNSGPNNFVGSGQSLLISRSADARLLFLGDDGNSIRRQEGYSGPETTGWAIGSPTGALGGDDSRRQFGFFTDGQIREFDPFVDTDSVLASFAAPAAQIEGLAYDGTSLYASDSTGNLFVLDADAGTVLETVSVDGGPLYGLAALSEPFDLSNLDGINGFSINGDPAYVTQGNTVGAAGDIDGDGFDDLLVGAPYAGPVATGIGYLVFGQDFTKSVSLLGTEAGETLPGDPAADSMIGGQGGDVLIGGGGNDVLRGGEGDDVLVVADLTFQRLDGGNGFDTLRIDPLVPTFDLTTIPDNRIQEIEQIDIAAGTNQSITLNRLEVLNASSTSNTLRVSADDESNVNLLDAADWIGPNVVEIDGVTYTEYTSGAARLLINDGGSPIYTNPPIIDGTPLRGSSQVRNTIVAENFSSNDSDVSGVFDSLGHNLIGDGGASSGFLDGENGDQVGGDAGQTSSAPTQARSLFPSSSLHAPLASHGVRLPNVIDITLEAYITGFVPVTAADARQNHSTTTSPSLTALAFSPADHTNADVVPSPLQASLENRPSTNLSPSMPDLAPALFSGWDSPLVISTQTGTNTDDMPISTTDEVFIDFGLANFGDVETATPFDIELLLDGNVIATVHVSFSILPNSGAVLQDYNLGLLTNGQHTLEFVIDSAQAVAESNEGNNAFSRTLMVEEAVALPDLAPAVFPGWDGALIISTQTGTNTDDSPISPLDEVFIDVSIANLGTAVAGPFDVDLKLDGILINASALQSLSPQQFSIVHQDFSLGSLSEGQHTLEIVIDPVAAVEEGDETNNTISRTFTVGTAVLLPDLVPAAFSGWDSALVISNQTGTNTDDMPISSIDEVFIDISILNAGNAEAAPPFDIELFLDGMMILTATFPVPLPPQFFGIIYQDFNLGMLSVGEHTLDFVIDPAGELEESNDANNTFSRTFMVEPGVAFPDLVPAALPGWEDPIVISTRTGTHADDAPIFPVDTIFVDVGVLNIGNSETGQFDVDLLLDGNLVNRSTHASLAAQGFAPVQVDLNLGSLDGGTHTLDVLIDFADDVEESNEANNSYSRTFVVTSNPNRIDPFLGPLQFNGGPTPTHALLAGSPAIDMGENLRATETDQRGSLRILDGDANGMADIDIGAYEFSNFFIETQIDGADANVGDGISVDMLGNRTLRAAIQEANSSAGADTILLRPGTYLIELFGKDEDAAATGDFDITGEVTMIGAGAELTTIDASQLDRVFHVLPGGNLTLVGVTVTGGSADDFAGGILNEGTLQLIGSVVDSNVAAAYGGGIATSVDSVTTLVDSMVTDNRADGLSIPDIGEGGGGIHNLGDLTIEDSMILDNMSASVGGGITNFDGTVVLQRSTVARNRTHEQGGGLYQLIGSIIAVNTTISGNQTTNPTQGSGAGIYSEAGELLLIHGTVTANQLGNNGQGTGIFLSRGTAELQNTIVAANPNAAGSRSDIAGPGEWITLGHNLIGDGTDVLEFVDGVFGDMVGTETTPVGPGLQPLRDNGGPTLTHALQVGSAAINAGDNTSSAGRDQRGTLRVAIETADIGAFEFAPQTLFVREIRDVADVCLINDVSCGLRSAVIAANNDPGTNYTIVLEAGTYALEIAGAGEDAAATGDLDIIGSVTILGVPARTTTIDAQGLDRVFHVLPGANLELRDVTVAGGALSAEDGAGVLNEGALTVSNARITENSTFSDGGGIATTSDGETTLTRVSVIGNAAANGAGIDAASGASINIVDSTIASNQAFGDGGGIRDVGSTQISGTTISGNSANRGGGLFSEGTTELVNTTVSGNAAQDEAGGILVTASGTLTLSSVTVFGNSADRVGGVSVAKDGTANFENTILAGNAAGSAIPDGNGVFVSQGYNLIGNNGADPDAVDDTGKSDPIPPTAKGFGSDDLVGTSVAPIDPLLGTLRDNGGPTHTHIPSPMSPVIDAGSPSIIDGVDQRGRIRPFDGDGDTSSIADIGAVELINDTIAPLASVDLDQLFISPGISIYRFEIVYTDDAAVDQFSLGINDIEVTGPNDYSQLARLWSVAVGEQSGELIATYEITPPGGSWDAADDGTYSISLLDNEVSDTSGNFAVGTEVAMFDVDFAGTAFPTIESLTASPQSLKPGETLMLTATDVDHHNFATDPKVRFYRDANHNGLVDPEIDDLVDVDADSSNGWSITIDAIAFPAGDHTFLAAASGTNATTINAATLGTPASAVVHVTETTPPRATLNAPDFVVSDDSDYVFSVTYLDDTLVDVSTLDGNDVLITGPNSSLLPAVFVGAVPNSDDSTIVATYRVSAPNEFWEVRDSGVYAMFIRADEVADVNNNRIAFGFLGVFTVEFVFPASVEGSIAGTVFDDANANGQQDGSELGRKNVVVFLDLNHNGRFEAGEPSDSTGPGGDYQITFADIPADRYAVIQIPEEERSLTTPNGIDFAANRLITSQNNAQSVSISDLNNDGHLDIVVANYNGGDVLVRLNDGQGGFATEQRLLAGSGPSFVISVDLDGDDDLDLAAANFFSGSISVFLNEGAGSFSDKLEFAVGTALLPAPTSITAADFDGDTHIDLAIANSGDDSLSLLLNAGHDADDVASGSPLFDDQLILELDERSGPVSVIAVDLDNDQHVDLAVTRFIDEKLSILWNGGASKPFNDVTDLFTSASVFDIGAGAYSVTADDLAGDSLPDLAIVRRVGLASGQVVLFRNDGSRTFTEETDTADADLALTAVTTGDLDGDGVSELVAANAFGTNISIWSQATSFGEEDNFPIGAIPDAFQWSIGIGDLDNDGAADVVVTDSNGVSILRNARGAHVVDLTRDALAVTGKDFGSQAVAAFVPLDTNQDGAVDASTDGNQILTVLFGLPMSNLDRFRGDTTLTNEEIEQGIQQMTSDLTLDVNEDGTVDASTDGNLILTVLFGLPISNLDRFRGNTSLTNAQIEQNVLDLAGQPGSNAVASIVVSSPTAFAGGNAERTATSGSVRQPNETIPTAILTVAVQSPAETVAIDGAAIAYTGEASAAAQLKVADTDTTFRDTVRLVSVSPPRVERDVESLSVNEWIATGFRPALPYETRISSVTSRIDQDTSIRKLHTVAESPDIDESNHRPDDIDDWLRRTLGETSVEESLVDKAFAEL